MNWAILALILDDTLVLRHSMDHCWVLLPASGLAQEQSHYSTASNFRGVDCIVGEYNAVINPGLLHTGHGHIFSQSMVISTPALRVNIINYNHIIIV